MSKPFQNLVVLDQCRETAKELLGNKYDEVVTTYIKTIQHTMTSKNQNHFEAMKTIQDTTTLADTLEKKTIFAAALMEIVEEKNLKNLV